MKKCLLISVALLISVIAAGQRFNVGERSMVFYDSLRNRQIKVEVWYPTNETDSTHARMTDLPFLLDPTIRNAEFIRQKFPLVLLSHGTGSNRFGLAWIAICLAKNGYIAVAPDHWGNTFDNKIPEFFVRYWERPLDISFLITHFLADKPLNQYINTDKIGMVGYSFGGYTSLALAGADLDCDLLKKNADTPAGEEQYNVPEFGDLRKLVEQINCKDVQKTFKDTRIKAFVALCPALGLGFNSPEQTKNIDRPVLIIGAENDRIAPIKTNAALYSRLIHGSHYILLHGKVGHYIFLNEAPENLKQDAKMYFVDERSVNRKNVHIKVENEILLFLRKSL